MSLGATESIQQTGGGDGAPGGPKTGTNIPVVKKTWQFEGVDHQPDQNAPQINPDTTGYLAERANTVDWQLYGDSLFNIVNSPKVLGSVFAEFGLNPEDNQDVFQQATIVAVGISPDVEVMIDGVKVARSHLNAVRAVVLSHMIDDVVDIYENNQDIREILADSIIGLGQEITPTDRSLEECFQSVISIVCSREYTDAQGNLHIIPQETVEQLVGSIPSPEQKYDYMRSMLKMIVTGLAITENKSLENTQGEMSSPQFPKDRLLSIYQSLHEPRYPLPPDFIQVMNTLPLELSIANISSLQAMFAAFDPIPHHPLVTTYFDGILGTMVFLNNFAKEREQEKIQLFEDTGIPGTSSAEPTATYGDYVQYIHLCARSIQNLWTEWLSAGLETGESATKLSGYRLTTSMHAAQLYQAHDLMLNPKGTHSYFKFPIGGDGNPLSDLSETFAAVTMTLGNLMPPR
jgi:hypothetical protein